MATLVTWRLWLVAPAVGLMMSALVVPAFAQTLDGPLAAPDSVTPQPSSPTHRAKPKARKPRHAAATAAPLPAQPTSASAPGSAPVEAPKPSGPASPLDLGMKWNGTSDGSAQTRYQNGLDGESGTGAEVGMKLHF